ncbi:SDR family NAD(P)-dependent oxidoreductase [Bradyrhizobium sp. AS23.2]|uniref:SDR family NAD(P)-dependent oxidoreductase n=1 Tax=Bradyrhizobium sp. AS23.2 TaxID=1680155 RepID=UPI00093C80C8|nr:SDR family NAD(P)-dependent oxidoreductase [Bradyrhizobium sp. AS23.2]OKO84573.1 3-oxoacyl-ACP reductase [Bradyrhizobium sp. AS23.2]
MTIRFDGRVAIVTGAGNGIGKSHALGLAARGAKLVVNDLGSATNGLGTSSAVAQAVVDEIIAAGGDAIADGADITNEAQVEAMVRRATDKWGRVDILINNAGILRDKTFSNMTMEDYQKVLDVHLNGTVICCKAVWPIMRDQKYGRIVLTSSTSGLYGNFGQAAYGVAKTAMVGLMNVLHLEGAKNDIRVTMLAPSAITRMTEGLLPEDAVKLMQPEAITPGALYLVSEDGPSRFILSASSGSFARIMLYETRPAYFPADQRTPEAIASHFANEIYGRDMLYMENAFEQNKSLVGEAAKKHGFTVSF